MLVKTGVHGRLPPLAKLATNMRKKYLITIGILVVLGLAIYGATGQTSKTSQKTVGATPTSTLPKVTFAPQRAIVPDTKSNYTIVFDPNYQTYTISVLNTPFDKIRAQAEGDLIKKLNLTPEAACQQVKVHIGSPYYVNPDPTLSYDTFSFCKK
jgi:hypothetical protein